MLRKFRLDLDDEMFQVSQKGNYMGSFFSTDEIRRLAGLCKAFASLRMTVSVGDFKPRSIWLMYVLCTPA